LFYFIDKKYEKDNSPLDFLDLSIYNCMAAINYKSHDQDLHFKLAMLLEEKHHVEDVYGFKNVIKFPLLF
jgi:hypothetical protein